MTKKTSFHFLLMMFFIEIVFSNLVYSKNERSLTKEQIEKLHSIQKAEELLQQIKLEGNKLSKDRKINCIKAFGSGKFCECLDKKLPWVLSFENYIEIITLSKDELKYSSQTDDWKKVIDKTIEVRDQCVEQDF